MIDKLRFLGLPLALSVIACPMITTHSHGVIFEEFLFNDPVGTAIENAANNANPGNFLDVDADNAGVVTNGLGQLDTSTKNNTAFGTNYVDTAAITTGKIYGVMELTWDFQSVLDPAENEQVRITLINSDPRSTQVTAEFRIERNDSDDVVIYGVAIGSGATGIPEVTLNGGSLTQTDKFIAVVAADLDTDIYEVLYSNDAGGTFLSAGTGMMDPGRGVEAMRMALNNDLVNDNILIDRIYLTDDNPISSIDALTLEVNTVSGLLTIKNDTVTDFDIDSYRIESPDPDSDLNFAGWNSFSDQNLDAVDGPDNGSTLGDGVGETWDEAAGSDNDVLAESFLLGSSFFGAGRSESLGNAFQPGGAETLIFEYRDAVSGAISEGNVTYVTSSLVADLDGDNNVDGDDLLLIQQDNPALIPSWQTEYGTGAPATAAAAAVPEPSSLLILGALLALHGAARRK